VLPGSQGVAGVGAAGAGAAGQAQAAGDIPDGQLPALLAGMLDDFSFGLIGLVRLNPQAGASGVDIVGQLFGQRHEPSVPFQEGFGEGECRWCMGRRPRVAHRTGAGPLEQANKATG
jgi:hypothetical protein